MLGWLGNWPAPRGSSARVCDTGMLLRSFAVTAAAAAFLVWRVFFQGGPVAKEGDQQQSEDDSARTGPTAAADQHGQPPSPSSNGKPVATAQSELEAGAAATKGHEHADSAHCFVASAKQDALLGPAQDGPTSPGISTAKDDAGAGEVVVEGSGTGHQHVRSSVAYDADEGAAEDAARRTLSAQLPSVQHVLTAARQAPSTSPRTAVVHAAAADAAAQPKLHLQVLTGPAAASTFSSLERQVLTVKIGRVANCELCINDQEVSGRHAVITFSEEHQCWYLADLGSLNGTLLNSRVISREGRLRSDQFQLADHDIVQLGTNTQVRVRCHPSPARHFDTGSPAAAQLLGSNARHLSPRQQAAAATLPSTAVHPALRVAAATLTRTGLLHVRHGSACEDVGMWQLPFPATQPLAAIGTTVDASFKQRATMEDSRSGGSSGSRAAGLFCVFDGHGGGACSAEARAVVPAAVAHEFGPLQPMLLPAGGHEATRTDAWERAYLAADATLSCDEGCTATTVLLERQEGGRVVVQAANVGDSTAVLVCMHGDRHAFPAPPPTITQLTAEHKVAEEAENARLRARGFQGKTRLYGLALSRSLGDKFLKEQDVGLLAVPYVSPAFTIAPDEEAVVVLASDGLWDVVSCEAAGNAAARILHGADGSAAAVAEGLMQMALLGRSQDDITVMAVHIQRANGR